MRTTPSRFTPFALALALAVPSLAAAQPDAGRRGGATAEERAERIEARMAERVEKLREELSLSDAQAARIARIFEESRAEMARLREAGRSPETRQAFRQLRWTTDDRIHEVLSAEQAEQLRQLRRDERLEHREARRGRRGMRGHHGHRGMRGERGPRGPRGERPELTPEQRQERRHRAQQGEDDLAHLADVALLQGAGQRPLLSADGDGVDRIAVVRVHRG